MIEIKLTSAPTPADMAPLTQAAALARADRWWLVSQTPEPVVSARAVSCNLSWLLDRLANPRSATLPWPR